MSAGYIGTNEGIEPSVINEMSRCLLETGSLFVPKRPGETEEENFNAAYLITCHNK